MTAAVIRINTRMMAGMASFWNGNFLRGGGVPAVVVLLLLSVFPLLDEYSFS